MKDETLADELVAPTVELPYKDGDSCCTENHMLQVWQAESLLTESEKKGKQVSQLAETLTIMMLSVWPIKSLGLGNWLGGKDINASHFPQKDLDMALPVIEMHIGGQWLLSHVYEQISLLSLKEEKS